MNFEDYNKLKNILSYPFDSNLITRKKKKIIEELKKKTDLLVKRIAILGGSTTSEFREILEIFLLNKGIQPLFYEGEFARYSEEILFENKDLELFKPDLIYIFTSAVNLPKNLQPSLDLSEVNNILENEKKKFSELWLNIEKKYKCPVLQNNFDYPFVRSLGNLDGIDERGTVHFARALNTYFAEKSNNLSYLNIIDINYLSSWMGISKWHDQSLWHSYKYAIGYDAINYLAHHAAAIISSIFGFAKKCLVLDLDNTLWGGIIGDDGKDFIKLGQGDPVGEAHNALQEYFLKLKKRGILLTIVSKNDEEIASTGLAHPDMFLSIDDFAVIKANWDAKSINIDKISKILNLGKESFAFIDDNPAERLEVSQTLPEVSVPDLGDNVVDFLSIIDQNALFETVALSKEDIDRSEQYLANAKRNIEEKSLGNYSAFLASLEMEAVIEPFKKINLERITQLINKTNQFNLTTKRYSLPEVNELMSNNKYLTISARLKDKFGDNGLVSVVIAKLEKDIMEIDVWLMSCRVIKRDLEKAIFDYINKECIKRNVKLLRGIFIPSKKNMLVKKHYESLGFELKSKDKFEIWELNPKKIDKLTNNFIKLK